MAGRGPAGPVPLRWAPHAASSPALPLPGRPPAAGKSRPRGGGGLKAQGGGGAAAAAGATAAVVRVPSAVTMRPLHGSFGGLARSQ